MDNFPNNYIPNPVFSLLLVIIILIFCSSMFANIEQEIDPNTKDLIQIICNQTRNSNSCRTMFMQNLAKPTKLDHEGFTWVAIDALLRALYENIEYLHSEKNKIMQMAYEKIISYYSANYWDILFNCEIKYKEIMAKIDEIRNHVRYGKFSMIEIGEMYDNFQGFGDYMIKKCELKVHNKGLSNLFLDDLGLLQEISKRNRNVGMFIQIVVDVGKNFAKVMVKGDEETKVSVDFMQFLYLFN